MKTIAIYLNNGTVEGAYEVFNAPHSNVIIIDDDDLKRSGDRITEARNQLEGLTFNGSVEFNELHSDLSAYISSEEINNEYKQVYLQVFYATQYVNVQTASVLLIPELKEKILALKKIMENNQVLDTISCFCDKRVIKAFFAEDFNAIEKTSDLTEEDFYIDSLSIILTKGNTLTLRATSDNDDEMIELDASVILALI